MEPMTFLADGRIVRASQEQSILGALIQAKVDINHSCGGFGTCGTCLVRVVAGGESLAPRGEIEAEMATDRNFCADERLACQINPCQGLSIEIPTAASKTR